MSKPILDVLAGRHPERRPIWFMRQAGRYLPEYRAVRARAGSFLDLCYRPELAAEVSLQPLRRYDLDAAIVFSDILVVPHAMGVGVSFVEGEGPAVEKIDSAERVKALRGLERAPQVRAVCETLAILRSRLPERVGLIGFCGAPWTVASYMIGGGPAAGRDTARLAALDGPPWFSALIDRLVENSILYLEAQVEAGAEVVQIFDSWAGDLASDLAQRWVVAPLARITGELKRRRPGTPVIVFARGMGAGHRAVALETGAEAVSVEPALPLAWAREALIEQAAVQGNLDPLALLAGDRALDESVLAIVRELPRARHIFNLGHGIRPETDPARLDRVIRTVRDHDRAG